MDVFDVDESHVESYRHDPDFKPSPKGTPYWVPNLIKDEKPKLGDIFDSFDAGYDMYKAYTEKGRFNVYEEKDGKSKRKRKTVFRVTNYPAKIGIKAIHGTDSYKVLDFVENHNLPLINENSMDLSRARRQLHFGDYMFIHLASLSNIGPTTAHRLKVALMGGYDKVRGTPGDYRNFRRAVNLFIRDRDAQMIVDKMIDRKQHVPEFSFEHHVLHDELVSMLWADETMKCTYAVFGDVVSFDATFRTNKYDFVFMPFTGFLKVHGKQPPLPLTDQDAALRNVVVKFFPDSKHRLCMWLITKKLPGKVLGDLETDSEFRKEFHKLIWNVRFNKLDGSFNCSCGHYTRHGYLCRHIFCVLRIHNIARIPKTYISRRWTKKALLTQLLEKRHRYGPCIEETYRLATEVHAIIEDYVDLLKNNTDKLTQFLTKVKEMKKQLEDEMPTSDYVHNKEALYTDLLGVTLPEQVVINNPKKSSNKGSKRRKSVAEEGKASKKPRNTRKRPFKPRTYNKCSLKGLKMHKCTGKKVDTVHEVDGVDEVAEEDEVQDVDEDYESDEHCASDKDSASAEDSASDEDNESDVN
nr:hypothetical protein [Tanacetum cinerariifolium]